MTSKPHDKPGEGRSNRGREAGGDSRPTTVHPSPVPSPHSSVLTTVWWEEDPTITRDVIAYCKRCTQGFEGGEEVEIISPSGIAHCEGRGEYTKCGINTAGLEWWWRT